jgi:regulation of enolase protein 1 (concanavalin A-like superfamily)
MDLKNGGRFGWRRLAACVVAGVLIVALEACGPTEKPESSEAPEEVVEVKPLEGGATVAAPIDESEILPSAGGLTGIAIGTAGPGGIAGYAEGVFTLKGGGKGISAESDAFHFARAPCNNTNFEVAARVRSLEGRAVAACGVMIRETLEPNSKLAMTVITSSEGVNFTCRASAGGVASGTQILSQAAPIWLKVTRNGDRFASYYSADGTKWTEIGSEQIIDMASDFYVGLCIASGADAAQATATIENVAMRSTFGR